MMKLQRLLQERREDVLAVADRHGAFNVRVFGSVSRGEETDNSDIDLLVDYDLKHLLDRKIDIVTEQGLSPLIKDRVLAEAKSL
jgi:predicted nucleotidyltransferase